jgi:hypothetical protein
VRTLADEQLSRNLALKLHLTLAQVLGLVARFGINSAKLSVAARKLAG